MNAEQGTASVSAAIELYGSFHLGDTELAIPAALLQEVVNYPSSVTRTPLAPAHVLGMFNLRGTLIPILDLRRMLRLGDPDAAPVGKVAIVELGEMRAGLLFDATGEVLRVSTALKIAFTQTGGDTPISACLKLDGGDRILQVLSVSALLGLPEVPHLQQHAVSSRRRVQQAQRRQTVSFRVGDTHLALPMEAIREIIRVPELHPSPLADSICVGMLNLRGTIVPVVEFARLIGAAATASPGVGLAADERRIVVLKQETCYFGLLVDEVRSIVGYRDDELLPMPAYARRQVDFFAGCLTHGDGGNIILLRAEALLTHAGITEMTRGHRDLYRNHVPQGVTSMAADRTGNRGVRETWVTFALEHLFGVPIRQLREVIDFPQQIVRAPGLPDHVLGVLNLRRELVTVIDLRKLYAMPPLAHPAQAKVLIVEHRGEKYGLVVDSRDNIVTIDAADRIKVPAMFMQQQNNRFAGCLTGGVELPGRGTLLLLDLVAVCAQAAGNAAECAADCEDDAAELAA